MPVDQIEEKIKRTKSNAVYKGFVTILKLSLLCCLLMLTACSPQTVQKSLNTFKKHLHKESQPPQYRHIPPRGLKTFTPVAEPKIEVLARFNTQDRFGNKRLQVYLWLETEVNEALLRRVSAKYQSQYDAVWLYIVNSKDHFPQQKWSAQAAWFSSKIPASRHYLGFSDSHKDQNFYWHYE